MRTTRKQRLRKVREFPKISITNSKFIDTTYGYSIDETTPDSVIGAIIPEFTGNKDEDGNSIAETAGGEPWFKVETNGQTKKYNTLAAAIEAANQTSNNTRVTVTITKSGTYDPFTITRDNVTVEAASDVTATFKVSSAVDNRLNAANITLRNLHFVSENGATIFSFGACDNLKLEKCTFTGNGTGTALYIHQPNITINGCTFKNFERGYYTCGDNHAAGEMTFKGNTFTNVRVPIDGYWGMKATDNTEITITGNTFDAGDWDASYIQLWDYTQYLEWLKKDSLENDRQGSAINATIENNRYHGNVVIYATHFNWFYDSELKLDNESKQHLKYRVLVELGKAESATVTKADGTPVTAFNENTTSSDRGNKKVIYAISEGDYLFNIKPVGSTGDGLVTQKVTVKSTTTDSTGGTTNKVTVTDDEQVNVAQVGDQKYTSLAEAINAAKNSGDKTVTLLANASIDTWDQIWNIDGLTINGEDHSITIGEVKSLENGDYLFYNAKDLNVSDLTINFETNGNGFDMVSGELKNVKLNGGESSDYGVFVGTSNDSTDPKAKVEINNCTFDNFSIAAVYSQPVEEEGKKTSDLSVKNSTFTNCGMTMCSYAQNTVFTDNIVNGGSEISFAGGAEGADRQNSYTITGNTFQNAGKIWFYGADLENVTFTKNKVLGDTTVSTADANQGTELDVSKNYWGGSAPNNDQLKGDSVIGSDVYYEAETMRPQDLNTYVPSSGGGGTVETKYDISVDSAANGTVKASASTSAKDKTVTLTVTPDEGYVLDTLTVTDKDGKNVELTKKSDTEYTFQMPSSKVTVKAVFKEEAAESTLPFTDVSDADWFYPAVKYVYDNDMMDGVGGSLFAPASQLTRGMIAQVLYNLEKATGDFNGSFTDVAADEWYADAVNWAAECGIVNGFGDGTFGPEQNITREQMAQILMNYAKYKGYDMTAKGDVSAFTDAAEISGWAQDAVSWAVGEKLLSGKGNGILDPAGTATRAEVAQIFMNFCENIAK